MRIVVDAFGGDNAPLEIIKGSALAEKEYGAEIILLTRIFSVLFSFTVIFAILHTYYYIKSM